MYYSESLLVCITTSSKYFESSFNQIQTFGYFLNKTVIINYGMNKNDIFTGKFIKKIST